LPPQYNSYQFAQMADLTRDFTTIISQLHSWALATWNFAVVMVGWRYFPHVTGGVAVATALLIFTLSYRKWRRAWLSDLVRKELHGVRREARRASRREYTPPSLASIWNDVRNTSFRGVLKIRSYLAEQIGSDLRTIYLPSFTSVLLVLMTLALILFIPHPPTSFNEFWPLTTWWGHLSADLSNTNGAPRLFGGLVAIAVALIVFVAESVRGSKNYDEKRVLLKVSFLWPMALLVTTSPLIFLYPPTTRLSVILFAGIMGLALVGFARVLNNLLNAGSSIRAQRLFLKDRVRRVVLYSAQERIGNKLLFERLGIGKEIEIEPTISRSWLPGRQKNYTFIPAPGHGTLSDINLDELKKLAQYLEQRKIADVAPQATEQIGETAGPRQVNTSPADGKMSRAYLLRRFQEEVPEDTIFSGNTSILAIPISLAHDKAIVEETRIRAKHIFKFSAKEPPSAAFRREMESTKDRLVAAIQTKSLGAIDDLKQTYLLIAEEFLTILTELGGGYSAKQARDERSSLFSNWSEVRWMVRDVRELLVAASETDNIDVIREIAFLPYAIATRALQAGDQLLFQEFLDFSSFLYSLASEKPKESRVRAFMTDRSWRHLRDFAEYHIQPLLPKGEDDE
jgi:hypothetical protein